MKPVLLHRVVLVSFLLFRRNLGSLREFFGQMVNRPPWKKIARMPMNPSYIVLQVKLVDVIK